MLKKIRWQRILSIILIGVIFFNFFYFLDPHKAKAESYIFNAQIPNPTTGYNIDFTGGHVCSDFFYVMPYININLEIAAKGILESYGDSSPAGTTKRDNALGLYDAMNELNELFFTKLESANCPSPSEATGDLELFQQAVLAITFSQFYGLIIYASQQSGDAEAAAFMQDLKVNNVVDGFSNISDVFFNDYLMSFSNTNQNSNLSDNKFKNPDEFFAKSDWQQNFTKNFNKFAGIGVAYAARSGFSWGIPDWIPVVGGHHIGISWENDGDLWKSVSSAAPTWSDRDNNVIATLPSIGQTLTGPIGMASWVVQNIRSLTRSAVNAAANSGIPIISGIAQALQTAGIVAKPEKVSDAIGTSSKCEENQCTKEKGVKGLVARYICKGMCLISTVFAGIVQWGFNIFQWSLATENDETFTPSTITVE